PTDPGEKPKDPSVPPTDPGEKPKDPSVPPTDPGKTPTEIGEPPTNPVDPPAPVHTIQEQPVPKGTKTNDSTPNKGYDKTVSLLPKTGESSAGTIFKVVGMLLLIFGVILYVRRPRAQ
ncbi:LPXTG cell wall anchor domain-containing protein, partial [Paenibacillus sp.]|uniref:LPXTG cell wall anchor domain-containing protein n=1 Tax=Paenibacillus sp. TaxID=58172 RepID=UPI0028AFE92E